MKVLGVITILLGILLGLYLGVWVMFIGGIVQIIQSVHPIVNALGLALGILRFMCSGFVGWVTFYVLVGVGVAMSGD